MAKKLKFKMNKVVCSECGYKVRTNKYKVKLPIPRKVPCSHIPDHLCEKKNKDKE